MKLSYDYEALIHEIKADIRESILLPDDVVWVLRKQHPGTNDYYPIIDWFRKNEIATKALTAEHQTAKKCFLEEMSVLRCLGEMEMLNRIL